MPRPPNSTQILDRRPRLIERVRIIDIEPHLDRLAVVNQFIALHDVELLGVRRVEAVQVGLVVLSDCVDDERIAAFVYGRRAVIAVLAQAQSQRRSLRVTVRPSSLVTVVVTVRQCSRGPTRTPPGPMPMVTPASLRSR